MFSNYSKNEDQAAQDERAQLLPNFNVEDPENLRTNVSIQSSNGIRSIVVFAGLTIIAALSALALMSATKKNISTVIKPAFLSASPFHLGKLSVAAGQARGGYSGDNIPATSSMKNDPKAAFFSDPQSICVDKDDNLFIGDFWNYRVRRVDGKTNIITTIAGTGTQGKSVDGIPGIQATIGNPRAVAVDDIGNVYFTDSFNHNIRKIGTDGIIQTIAGTGVRASRFVTEGVAKNTALNNPYDIIVDKDGNVIFVHFNYYSVQKITPDGRLSTLAGTSGQWDHYRPSYDNILATSSYFKNIFSIALDSLGNLYIADGGSYRIRKVDTKGIVTTFAGGQNGFEGDNNSPAISAKFGNIGKLVFDSRDSLYFSDMSNRRLRRIDTNGRITTIVGNNSLPLLIPSLFGFIDEQVR